MTEPRHHVIDSAGHGSVSNCGSGNHDHGQVQAAGGLQLCQSAAAARVFGDDMGDGVGAHQVDVGFNGKRAAIKDDFGIRQGQRIVGRIDKTQQVEMLRLGRKEGKCLLADGEENAGGFRGQGGDGGFSIGDMVPVIALLRRPFRAFVGDQRGVGHPARLNRVAADLGGKWVCGIDDMGDFGVEYVVGETLHTAVAAQSGGQGLPDRVGGASGIGKYGVDACVGESVGKRRCLGCATQKKDAHYG